MALRVLAGKLLDRLQRFRSAQGGNVLLTFSLAVVPIVGAVGAAVDYSRANSDKAAMQAAVDATALMLSKNVASLTGSQIDQEATNYFKALFTRTDVANLAVTTNYTTSGGSQVVVSATGSVNTTVLKVAGFSTFNLSVSSTVTWGNSRLRVALVLDNTGSMADAGKITALKTATNNLLTQLKNAASQNGDVYVSIIPFVKDVNVDPINYNQNWIYWDDALHTDPNSWDALNGTCSNPKSTTRVACVPYCSKKKKTYTTMATCVAAGNTWIVPTWTPANHNTWNGCVMDRGATDKPSILNTDTNVTPPSQVVSDTLLPAEQYNPCPQAAMGLSYNWTAMATLVNNMAPGGNTNQAVGLQLGWLSLVGGGPFTAPPMDPNYKYQQVIILLTDGLNTQDRWYTDQASIDAREQLTCDNINTAKITLYTVQVNTGGDPTSTLLQKCAGSPGKYPDSDKFFLLTSANAIVTTFNQIGTALSSLRVAK